MQKHISSGKYGWKKDALNVTGMEEKQEILDICNSEEIAFKTPSEIVSKLADRGSYIASESIFYKVLKEVKQLACRERKKQKHKC